MDREKVNRDFEEIRHENFAKPWRSEINSNLKASLQTLDDIFKQDIWCLRIFSKSQRKSRRMFGNICFVLCISFQI